ncbi:DUF3368 domain-containing protein [candidate division KSB3 bacterium]|uniref:DUF3368 domain-containing protein n=1 Tax=candidate division KSB3 bacterium TaxID=2044937 RepID=A0A2G6E622_9BACT|nr:MAG: DUF3368 domain-containing protein [candidate division KSB3 bacterium]PIE29915.1 MAG: DUF3368 domain-containing protein [candidate division KSB3 bacterium]
MIISADSSPLISLALINKLSVLEQLYREICVPTAVYDEVSRNDKPCSQELKQFVQGKITCVKNTMAVDLLLSDIGTGEAEAIVLALEHQPAMLLIDDLKARKLAKMKGLNIIGTLGILLQAKREGVIGEVKPLIIELLSNNIRIGTKIIEITLQAAQEYDI